MGEQDPRGSHTVDVAYLPTAPWSSQSVKADAQTALRLSISTADAARQGLLTWARDRLRSGVVGGVATTTVEADPTGYSKICHL